MIRNSFIFLDRFGPVRERGLWQSGISGWQQFLDAKKVRLVGDASKLFYDRQLIKARQSLLQDDSMFFSQRMPYSEHWRLYDYFRDQSVFLDIETSGLSDYDDITVVGLYDGKDAKTMIKGINLNYKHLQEELAKYKMIITFNGLSFDIPFIRKFISVQNIPHFDLRFGCRKLGLTGGLKSIERQLGIKRSNEVVAGMNGGDAAELWRMHKGSGDDYYLNLLVEYNEEDVLNLKPLADYVYNCLEKSIFQLDNSYLAENHPEEC
ncbi:ribonuclease H-like domain-containing protein [Candidatus Woesearchaeota archaeon]|nr:ribonuclease H-like domain-containing protein [Candidatus Woesearchaeota archaeon]